MRRKGSIYLVAIIIVGLTLLAINTRGYVSANGMTTEGSFLIQDFPESEVIPLNGQWDFFWHDLYTPQDFKENRILVENKYVDVPNPWSSYVIEGEKLPKTGYATYRLLVEIPDSEVGTVKAIYIPGISSAYSIWIDDEKRSEIGEVGKSHNEMKPGRIPKTIFFITQSNEIEIVIQVSNFFQRKAGIFDPIYIGESETMMKFQEKNLFFRTMVIVSLWLMGLYHLTLFLFRKKEPQFILFGILCLIVGMRALLINQGLVPYVLPFLNWELSNKIEYLCATLAILFFSLFTYTQFTEDMSRKIRNLIIVVFSMYSLFIILSPAIVFTKVMILLQIFIMLTFIYLFYVYITALIRKRLFAPLISVAVGFLALTALNDILYFNNLIQTAELTSIGLVFFMLVQAIIISKKYSMSFLETEKLSHDLAILNASLEQQIQERTMELQYTNKELHVANQKLNDAHQSRSKWLHNIAHEIAAPLTSIRSYTKGMLDGIVPGDRNYLQVVYDQSLYLSRMLEDLRDVTEMENNQIQFHLEEINIQKYTHNLYEKYKLEIEKQGVTFIYKDLLPQQEEEYVVFIDTMRIEQVIVNLLKNAQRFVDDNGKITIELGIGGERQIIIRVIDNGAGLEDEELDLIFNRFYRGNKQGKPHNGSGLGLPISKEIIDYHKGKLGATSKLEEGSCFYFTLPLIN